MQEALVQLQQVIEGISQEKMPIGIQEKGLENIFLKSIPKGEVIVHVGDKPAEFYFVVNGIFRSYYIDREGNDVTRIFTPEGSGFGVETLFNEKASPCCIEALESSKVLVIPGQQIKKLIHTSSYFTKFYINLLEESIHYKIERESSFLLKSATERYLDFKRHYPKLEERVNQSYIASYLGITPVSLSRIRKTIREEN